MLRTRVITAVCLVAGLLSALFYLPPLGWAVFCAAACALAAWEWAGLAGWDGKARIGYAVAVAGFILVLASPEAAVFQAGFYLLAVVFWLLIVPPWLRYKWPLRAWSAVLVGFVVLVPYGLVFVQLREHGPWVLLSCAAIASVADIAAYFFGRAFGGRKLAPGISPGKTWAGAVGAVLGVVVYCNIIVFAKGWSGSWVALAGFQVLFAGLAVLSIVGDLFESLIKRQAGAKDSSNLLPGHGGFLDRIDSMTAVVPVGFAIMMFALPGL